MSRPQRQFLFALALLALTLLLVFVATDAQAEGETVTVNKVTCQDVTITGGGYTPSQTLLAFARAPQGEGTITDPVEIKANAQGQLPSTSLKFGGEVPDGTYQAVITTPGPGEKEEVVAQFQVRGCLAGARAVVAQADCQKVDVTGTGFEQTEATVEVLILGEGEMKAQVFPDAQGRFSASIPWDPAPLAGQHTVEAQIDGITRAAANFSVGSCGVLPFTGFRERTLFVLIAVILILVGAVVLILVRTRRN